MKYGISERFLAEAALYPAMEPARVVSQYNDLYKIATEAGERLAEVSGKFRYSTARLCNYPGVGDFVMIDPSPENSGNAIIQTVLTRKSVFERAAVGMSGQTQVVAANVDVVFICMSLNNDYNPSRLERYLSVAWNSGATPVVILTKSDLCADAQDKYAEITRIALGVDIIMTSSFDERLSKADALSQAGVTTSFIGSSGVGKSTLINRLSGEDLLPTADIGLDDKGRHTTTRR
jgi:ribosome biogenesis GTPase